MSTERQKTAARKNLKKARAARATSRPTKKRTGSKLSTAEQNKLSRRDFAFPEERKEPLVDARHVRNAIARFDQVEGVTDAERDEAWKRIRRAAKKFDVEVSETSWRDLFSGGKARKKSATRQGVGGTSLTRVSPRRAAARPRGPSAGLPVRSPRTNAPVRRGR